jgi:signal peptidase II
MMQARVLLLSCLCVLGLVGCDLGSKQLAHSQLRRQAPVRVVAGVFDLRYTENRDVGFNALRAIPEKIRRPLVLALGALVVGVVLFLLLGRRVTHPLEQLGLLLVLGGAIGNLADRALRGYVVDFLHLHGWPVFNLADVYLVAGTALLVVLGIRPRKTPQGPTR